MQIEIPEQFQAGSNKDAQPWLLSYSDMVTLLLAFFVLFFAVSQVDQSKFEMIMQYFNKSNSTPLHVLEQRFKELIAANNLEKSVQVDLTPDGLLVNFQDNILFDSGKADLKKNAFPILGALSEILNAEDVASRRIQVEGHTDTVPLAKNADFPSNWELSSARAAGVIRFLIAHRVAATRFVAVGYADTRPRQPETATVRGLPVNRRVALLIK